MCNRKPVRSIIFRAIYGVVWFRLSDFLKVIVKICELYLSNFRHEIGNMNHQPMFKVRLSNNGMLCMPGLTIFMSGMNLTSEDELVIRLQNMKSH